MLDVFHSVSRLCQYFSYKEDNLKKYFIIITGHSTLFSPKTQEFVRAVLIAFGNKNLFPEF